MAETPSTTAAVMDTRAPFTDADSGFDALVALLDYLAAKPLHLHKDDGETSSQIMHSRWLWSIRANPTVAIDAPAPDELDIDARQYGVVAPFHPWEHDSTGLVHVLWGLHHHGKTLADDRNDIAATIIASRWLAAQRADAAAQLATA
jgi:hypothetical protein